MPANLENTIKRGWRLTENYIHNLWPYRLFRKYLGAIALAFSVLLIPAGSTLLSPISSYGIIPTIDIINVVTDQSVTIRTYNYPANQNFRVTMGPMGTRGINGIEVGTINSGQGGTFDTTFSIPPALAGSYQISIRLQTAHLNPYYSFNWFYNDTSNTSGPGGIPPIYSGIPTFRIINVVKDTSVTIETNNFPPNQTFYALMGMIGTRGIGGVPVGSFDSGAGGTLTAVFNIPDSLKGQERIAIRTQTTHANPYYSFNYFYNADGNVPPDTGQGGGPENDTPLTINITAVVRNFSVTFQTIDYPANQNFAVFLGPSGSRGLGGILVGQFASGAGGSFPVTVPIPARLANSEQIDIRVQTSHRNPYYSYNFFSNATTP